VRTSVETITDLQNLAQTGFSDWKSLGEIYVAERGPLRLFNYTAKAQFEGRWNFIERISRGLILNAETGEVVARPFDKFFNWGEGGRYSDAPIKKVTEKIDGSLGILYRENGGFRVATRGSFDSDQAVWATEFLNRNYNLDDLPPALTLLFEIVYPANRIVIDYQKEDLVLLAARSRFTGGFLSPEELRHIAEIYKFSVPFAFRFETPDKIVEAAKVLPPTAEGWVAEFADGERFKFKGDEYRKLHKLISGLSFKSILAHVEAGTLAEAMSIIPDEYLAEVRGWEKQILEVIARAEYLIGLVFYQAPKASRKEFALWANEYHPSLAAYLFAMWDNRPLKPLIFKFGFKEENGETQNQADLPGSPGPA